MSLITRSRRWIRHRLTAVSALAAAAIALPALASAETTIVELEIKGAIGVATAEYLSSGLEHARDVNADLVIINMDTPGGLVSSLRDMVQDVLASPIPVVSYVTPAGARADSAGTYLMLASHVAAMTPTSHLGAATPVSMTGEDATPPPSPLFEPPAPEEPPADEAAEDGGSTDGNGAEDESAPATTPQPGSAMERKVLNDAIAYIRSLAERHGRNADWAEKAVTEAATLTAREALEQNVIDFVAEDRADLLRQMEGKEVKVLSDTVAISTADPRVETYEPGWRIELLNVIANPQIVLLLGMLGFYGLIYEFLNPGAVVPGVVGVICLLFAAYGTQLIPVNYAGLALILLGLGLMAAEAFAPSFGALGLGGIAAFVIGAIIMFDSDIPGFGISIMFVLGIAVVAALFIIWLVSFTLKLRKRGAVSGRGSIVGGIGVATEDFVDGGGKIWLEGESWAATSKAPIKRDDQVLVTAMNGLVLDVKPAPRTADREPQPQT